MAGFQHDIAGGNGSLIITQLQSPNFSLTEQTGWAILKDGRIFAFSLTATGSVSANTVIISGSGDGLFIYDGIPAYGNLILSITNAAGQDDFGNAYSGPGISLSAPGFQNEIQIRPDLKAMLVYG